MQRSIPYLLIALIIFIALNDPVLAGNKFTKIGGGVVGSNDEKIEFLKTISGIFGGFMIILGILSFVTRNRFEGLIGMVTGKTFEAVTIVPIILIILGSIMVLNYFF